MNPRFHLCPTRALAAVIAVFLLAASPVGAQSTVEEQVMTITQDACDAAREGDIDALRRLLAPEFRLVGSNAVVQSREEFLAEIESGDPEYDVFRNHDMTAHVYDDAAIVQGITSLAGRAGGEPFELDVQVHGHADQGRRCVEAHRQPRHADSGSATRSLTRVANSAVRSSIIRWPVPGITVNVAARSFPQSGTSQPSAERSPATR